MRKLGYSLLVVVVLIALGSLSEKKDWRLGAWVACQQFVEQRLRAPSTASWPVYDQAQYGTLEDGSRRVVAWVDAQNAFGAKIRTAFDCVVQEAGKDTWRLVRLTTAP